MLSTQNNSNSLIRRNIRFKFGVYTGGILLNFAGYLVLLNLQSSINIENGAGAASVTATYVTAAVFGITFTPVLLRRYGAKVCMIISEITYFVYILLNYYPAYFTLIPAGVIVGIGEAITWPSMILYCVHFAKSYSCYSNKTAAFYVTEFIGIFYFIYKFSSVFGNLLGYAILYGGRSPLLSEDGNMSTPIDRDLTICGRNDCQDPNVTDANLNRYEPASKILIYILIGVTAGLVLLALLVQIVFVEKITSTDKQQYSKVDSKSENEMEEIKEPSVFHFIGKTLKATFNHLLKPKQLLIMPFAFYSGLVYFFAFGEVTRAYGSCIFGVEKVGLLAAITGGADGFASYATSKITSRAGVHVTMAIGFCVDIAFYMTCLFWIPDQNSTWVVYFIFAGIGISDGTWQPLVNELHRLYFPNQLDIALSVWNLFFLIGITSQASWSTALCVYQKIYIHISLLCFSFICYAIAQFVICEKKTDAALPTSKVMIDHEMATTKK